jgi:hypothetical protein
LLEREDLMCAVEAYFVADNQNGIPRVLPEVRAD